MEFIEQPSNDKSCINKKYAIIENYENIGTICLSKLAYDNIYVNWINLSEPYITQEFILNLFMELQKKYKEKDIMIHVHNEEIQIMEKLGFIYDGTDSFLNTARNCMMCLPCINRIKQDKNYEE